VAVYQCSPTGLEPVTSIHRNVPNGILFIFGTLQQTTAKEK